MEHDFTFGTGAGRPQSESALPLGTFACREDFSDLGSASVSSVARRGVNTVVTETLGVLRRKA